MVGALAGMGLPVIAAQGRQAANSAPISTALSGQVTAPGTASAGPVKIKKSLKFGMVQEEGTILEKFKLLKELGFDGVERSEEHTSELQSLMRNSYDDFCLNKKKYNHNRN